MENLKDKKILVICESPNKVAHIKEYLKEAGYLHLNVVASVGHISNIKDNKNSYKNTGIHPDDNFKLDFAVTEDKKEVVKNLKAQADAADIVCVMSDPDREGSQIAWSLIKFLGLKKEKYRRVVTHEITPKAVVDAIEHPIQLEEDLIESAQARAAIDKLIGYALSPVARTYIGAKSVGRCQSAGLKIICDREREIQNFKPEIYYDLFLHFTKNKTEFKAKYAGTKEDKVVPKIYSKEALEKIKTACTKEYTIMDITKKEKQESPKPPFTTTTFQQEIANRLGLKVKDIMSIAQALFENGKITYHRTDSPIFSQEFLAILKPFIESTYGKEAYTTPRIGKMQEGAQQGHECLRVTDLTLTPEKAGEVITNELQLKVYKIIWQRTVAAALPNAVISETTYSIDNNGQRFSLVSNELIKEGYKQVYTYKDSSNEGEASLIKETFTKGELLQNCKLQDQEKQTNPPARYSEATLVKKLTDLEIGRPSTTATIIETVLSPARGYAVLEDKKIVPTERGMQLSAFLDRSFGDIINLKYTKEMEKSLDQIAAGKVQKIDFLKTFFEELEASIKKSTEGNTALMNTQEHICPKCGSPLVVRRSKFGTLFRGCSNYPKCHYCEKID